MQNREGLQILALFLALAVPGTCALQFSLVENCVSPYTKAGDASPSSPAAATVVPGIAIKLTAAEFYESYAGIFRLSDGSKITAPARERVESLRYMQVCVLCMMQTRGEINA